jgi:hypothetical protein
MPIVQQARQLDTATLSKRACRYGDLLQFADGPRVDSNNGVDGCPKQDNLARFCDDVILAVVRAALKGSTNGDRRLCEGVPAQ